MLAHEIYRLGLFRGPKGIQLVSYIWRQVAFVWWERASRDERHKLVHDDTGQVWCKNVVHVTMSQHNLIARGNLGRDSGNDESLVVGHCGLRQGPHVEEDNNLRPSLEFSDELCKYFWDVIAAAANLVEEDAETWGRRDASASKLGGKSKTDRTDRTISRFSGNRVVARGAAGRKQKVGRIYQVLDFCLPLLLLTPSPEYEDG